MQHLWQEERKESTELGPRPQDGGSEGATVLYLQPPTPRERLGESSVAYEGSELPDDAASRLTRLEDSVAKIQEIFEAVFDQLQEQGIEIT